MKKVLVVQCSGFKEVKGLLENALIRYKEEKEFFQVKDDERSLPIISFHKMKVQTIHF